MHIAAFNFIPIIYLLELVDERGAIGIDETLYGFT
jgi:hypothetical protein